MSERDYEAVYASMAPLFDSLWLKRCGFANEFRNEWRRLLRASARDPRPYPSKDEAAVLPVAHSYQGTELTFHFDQLKLWDWYVRDGKETARRVFLSKDMKRTAEGTLEFHDSECTYDSGAEEPAVPERGKEIFVCALPGSPPPLRVVYGNRRVEGGFTGLRKNRLPFYLVQTDFVPAFLCDSFEVCAYLFWMDCCIIGENCVKVGEKDLKPLLHIFRPSSMLTVKGLL